MTALLLAGILLARPLPPPEPVPVPRPPIYATSYNWELSGVNCDVDCSQVASGLFTRPEMLGHVAACPADWVGRPEIRNYRIVSWETTVVSFPGTDVEPRYCVDVFGDPRNRQLVWLPESRVRPSPGGHYVYRIDFAESDPGAFPYNQRVLPFWRTETRPVPREWYAEERRE